MDYELTDISTARRAQRKRPCPDHGASAAPLATASSPPAPASRCPRGRTQASTARSFQASGAYTATKEYSKPVKHVQTFGDCTARSSIW